MIAGFFWLPELLEPQYFGLRHKGSKWYGDFAAACDLIIAQHSRGTNENISFAATDPSIPQIIRDVHPIKLEVGPQRVWMLLGGKGLNGFGLEWRSSWDDTNVWILQTIRESHVVEIYSADRRHTSH